MPQACLNCTREDGLTKYTHTNLTDVKGGSYATTYTKTSMDVWICNDCYVIAEDRKAFATDLRNMPLKVQLFVRGLGGIVILIVLLLSLLTDGISGLGVVDYIFIGVGIIILLFPNLFLNFLMAQANKYTPMDPTMAFITIGKNDKISLYSSKFGEIFKEMNPELEVNILNWDEEKKAAGYSV